ncbi:MAG: AEC family transporter, partial [Acetobacteraceae bacterium]
LLAVLTIALPVFGLILAGVVAGRMGGLGAAATEALNRFVVNLALPAVLFHAMAHIDPADLAHPGLLAAFGGAITVPFILSIAWSRWSGARLGDATIQAMAATFSNVGYMGLPLCRIAFGDASLVPGVITMVITACPQFAAAVILLELDRPGRAGWWAIAWRVTRALVRNPLLIAPVAGLTVALAGAPIPVALDRFLTLMGGAATPCALVATGLMLVQTAGRFRFALVGRLVCLKLLVKPAVAWVIAFHLVAMPPAWAETAVIMAALPTGAGAFILARLYDREAAVTSGAILVSTVLSFATLSVLLTWLA